MVGNLLNVDAELAKRVAEGLGIELPQKNPAAREPVDMAPSPALSIQKNMRQTIEGRKIGILIADGSDAHALQSLVNSIEDAKATAFVVAPKVGKARLSDGSTIKADGQLAGSPSQLFDAVAVLLSGEGTGILMKEGAAVQWVMNAFVHLKAIGYTPEALPLLQRAGVELDEGVVALDGAFFEAAAKRYWYREPNVRMLA
jgi:catalase